MNRIALKDFFFLLLLLFSYKQIATYIYTYTTHNFYYHAVFYCHRIHVRTYVCTRCIFTIYIFQIEINFVFLCYCQIQFSFCMSHVHIHTHTKHLSQDDWNQLQTMCVRHCLIFGRTELVKRVFIILFILNLLIFFLF